MGNYDVLGSLTKNKEFRSLGSRFCSLLLLAKGNIRGLAYKMIYTCHVAVSDKVMVENIIMIGSIMNIITLGTCFLGGSDIAIKGGAPIILKRSSPNFMVEDSYTETCSIRRIATKVAIHAFKLFKMAFLGHTTITRYGRITKVDIKMT
jgi:hypothetical protein